MKIFLPDYKNFENESTPENDIAGTKYKQQMLDFFEIDTYDWDKMDVVMKELFEDIKDDPIIRTHLEKYKEMYFLENLEMTLVYMFSYDHFDNFMKMLIEKK